MTLIRRVELSDNDLGKDAWGRPKTIADKSLFHGMFSFNIPVSKWKEYIDDVEQTSITRSTSVNGAFHLQAGATLNDKTKIQSFRNPRYEPNRGYLYSTACIIENPNALMNRKFGAGTEENGVFFSLELGVLYGVVRTTRDGVTIEDKNIIDTIGIDLSKGNVFDIQFQWRGVGDYKFYINLKEVFNTNYLGTLTELSMANPALPAFFESENLGDNSIIKFGCVDITTEGGSADGKEYGSVGITNESGQIAITGFNVPITVLRSKRFINGSVNTRDSIALLATGYSDNKSLLRVWATRDETAITTHDQSWVDFGDGHLEYLVFDDQAINPMTFDTTKAQVIFEARVGQDNSYSTSALFEGRTSIYQTPGDTFIFTMHRENGQGAVVGVTYEFAESI